ncbi:MAG: DNA adenine methylase [Candidatus Nomurabacteria bacterium]|nr:DNA adenine methylase [Candidatus Nomurabacteria bacterium]
MRFYSPLRYPGGKNKLAKFIALVCEKNSINGHYIEPYAGGASVALHLLINGYVKEVTINDLDRAIYAFWYSVLNDTDKFCNKIRTTKITIENWRKFKEIHKNKDKESLFSLGFATFFLNRTNHSGVIDGGVIGGIDQKGNYKIDCRFNKKELIERIKLIAKHKANINLFNLDALKLIEKIQEKRGNKNTIFYFDPPYYLKGPSLYMSHYKQENHKEVSEKIQEIKNTKWIVSYDNTPEIKKLYLDSKKKEYSFFHTAYEIREGKEVLFSSCGLIIPRIAQPTRI